MGLRCKEGDMAYILVGPLTGYTVKVIRFIGTMKVTDQYWRTGYQENLWEIRCDSVVNGGFDLLTCADHQLNPIRPSDLHEEEVSEKELTV